MGGIELLTIPEVAAILSVSKPRAYELARMEAIPVVRVGRQVRVDAAKLERWIDEGGFALTDDQCQDEAF